MTAEIDYGRMAEIIATYQPMEDHERYYVKNEVACRRACPLAPGVAEIIANACSVSRRVLDVGCGRGKTLLDNAHLFEWGAGQDESAEHMIVPAIQERDRRGIRNVEFFVGKARLLLFEDEAFDLVFADFGPVGHSDVTLQEVLRVLRPGGLVLIETGWDFETLRVEKERLERHGVEVQVAATFVQRVEFDDVYEFAKHRSATWTDNGFRHVAPDDRETIDRLLCEGRDENGVLNIEWGTILVGGRKRR